MLSELNDLINSYFAQDLKELVLIISCDLQKIPCCYTGPSRELLVYRTLRNDAFRLNNV